MPYTQNLQKGEDLQKRSGTFVSHILIMFLFWLVPAQVFAAPGEIKGRVFEDMNYSGGASRSFANAPGAKGINGAFVELYQKQGASFVKTAFTRTDSEGNYIFQGLSENDYRVRVLNNRNRPVSSARASSGKGGSGTILGTSIYRFDPDGGGTDVTREIGGRDPAAQTDAAETGAGAAFPAGSLIWTELTLGAGGADGVDFGFNFSTITNTNDTGPGSLRQFVENANGLVNTGLNVLGTTDTEVSVFEIPLTNGAAPRITLAREISIKDDGILLTGTTQKGVTSGTPVSAPTPVGTQKTVLPPFQEPFVQITGRGLIIEASKVTISGFDFHSMPGRIPLDVKENLQSVTIRDNWVGVKDSLTTNRRIRAGIFIDPNTQNMTLSHNYIAHALGEGISFKGSGLVEKNYFRRNGLVTRCSDNLSIENSARGRVVRVESNFIEFAGSMGIEALGIAGGARIINNSITTSGQFQGICDGQVENAGIRLSGTNSLVEDNVIYKNLGHGIVLQGFSVQGNRIRDNVFYANGGLALDLVQSRTSNLMGDGVSVNDSGDTDTGANMLFNFPVFEVAELAGDTLTLKGWARPDSEIDLYLADIDSAGRGAGTSNIFSPRTKQYGEGDVFITSFKEGSSQDTDTGQGSYDEDGNKDNTSAFLFTLNLSSLPAEIRSRLKLGALLTAIATDASNNTSEFSPVVAITPPPVVGYQIAGRVFEDVQYGGGPARRFIQAPGAQGLSNVLVELYRQEGANFVKTAETLSDADGNYSFSGVERGTYRVRPVNSAANPVRSSRPTTSLTEDVASVARGVLIYRHDPDDTNPDMSEWGGRNPSAQDDAVKQNDKAVFPLTALNWTEIVLVDKGVSGADFGFNFDTVTNTNTAGPGSLRQFILNANTLANTGLNQAYPSGTAPQAGWEYAIFAMPEADTGYLNDSFTQGGGKAFVVRPQTSLPVIRDGKTGLDGRLRAFAVTDPNTSVQDVSTGPRVIINGDGLTPKDSPLLQTNAEARFLYLGFVDHDHDGLRLLKGATGSQIESVSSVKTRTGVYSEADTVSVRNSIARENTREGLHFMNAKAADIQKNSLSNNKTGIAFTGEGDTGSVKENKIFNRAGVAQKQEQGLRIQDASGLTIEKNTIYDHTDDGLSVENIETGKTPGRVTITQNSFYHNGRLGIDLVPQDKTEPTLNDNGDTDTGPNTLLNFPVFESLELENGRVMVKGWSRPGAKIELFLADVSPGGPARIGDNRFGLTQDYGEGQVYLTTFTEGSADDTNTQTGPYTDRDNNQDSAAARFSFTLSLTSLPSGVRARLTPGALLTATATDAQGNTSEFSPVGEIKEPVLTPFICAGSLYLSQLSGGGATQLNTVSVSGETASLTPLGDTAHGYAYNALGYRTQDNFIYAMQTIRGGALLRFEASGKPQILSRPQNLPAGVTDITAGDVAPDGTYYGFYSQGGTSRLFKVPLTNPKALSAEIIALSSDIAIEDFAFNPKDGWAYAFDKKTQRFVGLNPATGEVKPFGPAYGDIGGTKTEENAGAFYADKEGQIYAYFEDGRIFLVETGLQANGSGQRVLVAQGPKTEGQDGASCRDSTPFTSNADLAVTIKVEDSRVLPGLPFTYVVTATNKGPLNTKTVAVELPLLPDQQYFVSDDGKGAYDPKTGVWTLGDLASGASRDLKLTMVLITTNPVEQNAEITGKSTPLETPDPDLSNNRAKVTVTPGTETGPPLPPLSCSAPKILDWAKAGWTAGSLTGSVTGDGFKTDITITGNAARSADLDTVLSDTAGLRLEADFASRTEAPVVMSLVFDQPVRTLNLRLAGLDKPSEQEFDRLKVRGYQDRNSSLTVAPLLRASSAKTVIVNDQAMGFAKSSDPLADKVLRIAFEAPVQKVELILEADHGALDNPSPQSLALGNFSLCLDSDALFSLTPDQEQTTQPGSSVVYKLDLNVGKTLTPPNELSFSLTSSQKLTWVFYGDTDGDGQLSPQDKLWKAGDPIPSGSSVFFAKTMIPTDLDGLWRDQTRVEAVLKKNGGVYRDSAQLITRASAEVSGEVVGVKTMAVDQACDGTPDGAFAETASARPGACVLYRIAFRNEGDGPVSQLTVHDAVPPWTSYVAKSARLISGPQDGAPAGTISEPAAGRGGLVFGFSSSVPPGKGGEVEFSVKVNDK